jgi:hypothetical protein
VSKSDDTLGWSPPDGTATVSEILDTIPDEVGPDTHPDLWADIEAAVDRAVSTVGKTELREKRREQLGIDTTDTAENGGGGSRHYKGKKSVNADFDGLSDSEIATILDAVDLVHTKYPEKSRLKIAANHAQKIRRDFARKKTYDWWEEQPTEWEKYGKVDKTKTLPPPETLRGKETLEYEPKKWLDAVKQLLIRYYRAKHTTIHLRYGDDRRYDSDTNQLVPKGETYAVAASMRWDSDYQKRYASQIDGWIREMCGGTRPSGGETDAQYRDPHISLITLSASAKPDGGDFLGPVDHMVALRDSWETTYHALRNAMVRAGFEPREWTYDRRLEPHTSKRGGGINAGYAHEHIILITDGPVSKSDLMPVVDTHVEQNPYAKADAHGDRAVEIKRHSELTNAGKYVADYCSLKAEPLEDRSAEYLMFAAAATASHTRTLSRSESATAASKADLCRQRSESDRSRQTADHGDEITWKNGRVVCRHCESHHDVEQYDCLSDARMAAAIESHGDILPDGGTGEIYDSDAVVDEMRDIWQDTDSGGRVGYTPDLRLWVEAVDSVEDPPPPWTVDSKREMLRLFGLGEWDRLTDTMVAIAETVWSGGPAYRGEPAGWDTETVDETGWTVDSVEIFGKHRQASAGGGVDMVEVTNYAQLFSGLYDPDGPNTCLRCGGTYHGSDIADHVAGGTPHPDDRRHMISDRSVAAWVILPDRHGVPTDKAMRCIRHNAPTGSCDCGGHTET